MKCGHCKQELPYPPIAMQGDYAVSWCSECGSLNRIRNEPLPSECRVPKYTNFKALTKLRDLLFMIANKGFYTLITQYVTGKIAIQVDRVLCEEPIDCAEIELTQVMNDKDSESLDALYKEIETIE